ncbi:uncharacterized protein LOC133310303 [Gastrolobium bilobum]|uniref:uncharacterized protein LOC133310303 n=1 Tax=Gastrolobium bilobum TaxID=150636 RepID=UPI002AB03E52|nr:uncharacterized protein LOC133310303 [Gastrolobium bilobum]
MDFVVGFPRTQARFDSIWVIVNRLTKFAHFLPVRVNFSMEKLAKLYVDEIVRLHGIPVSIVSDRDPKFISRFWGALQQAFGTQLRLSTAYHPQTDGDKERFGPNFVQETSEQIAMIRDKLKQAQNRQKSYYDNKHRPLEFKEEEHMFVRLSPVTGVGRALRVRKLSLRFIGPYQISKHIGMMAYQLALPSNLSNIHDVFLLSQLRRYIPDESHVVIPDNIEIQENLKNLFGPMFILEGGEKKLRSKVIPMVPSHGFNRGGLSLELTLESLT